MDQLATFTSRLTVSNTSRFLASRGRVVGRKNRAKFQQLPRRNDRVLCRYCAKEVAPPRRTFCSEHCVHQYRLRSDSGYIRQCVLERDRGVCALCLRNAHILYIAAAHVGALPGVRSKLATASIMLSMLPNASHPSGRAHTGNSKPRRGRRSAAQLREECVAVASQEWLVSRDPKAGQGASCPDMLLSAASLAALLFDSHFRSAARALEAGRRLSPGHFWQVDHILPVVEGGGAPCSLVRLRCPLLRLSRIACSPLLRASVSVTPVGARSSR